MILIVVGTRPEIIKMSPIIRECTNQGLDYSVVHTGQHYSYAMDKIFFEQLNLSLPEYNLEVGPEPRVPRPLRFLRVLRMFCSSIPWE